MKIYSLSCYKSKILHSLNFVKHLPELIKQYFQAKCSDLVFAGYDAPSGPVALVVDEPGRPVSGHAVVHRVVDVQDVVLLEGQLRRVERFRHSVEHRANEVAVARLVLDHLVFWKKNQMWKT